MEKFVVIGNSRTGTSMLRTSIDNHPDCSCFGEILIYYDHDRFMCHKNTFNNENYFDKNGNRTIKEFLDENLNKNTPRSGFKILSYDIEYWNLWNFFNEENYKVIMTFRNYLSSYISHLQGVQTGQFNIYNKKEHHIISKPVTLNHEEFYKHLEMRTIYDLKAIQKINNIHIVKYYDLLFNYRKTMDKVFKFLKVPMTKVSPETIKLNDIVIKNRVSNLSSFFEYLNPKYSYLKENLV